MTEVTRKDEENAEKEDDEDTEKEQEEKSTPSASKTSGTETHQMVENATLSDHTYAEKVEKDRNRE